MIWADRFAVEIFIILVLVFGWDLMGNNSLHGLDFIRWLLLPPAVGFVVWIVLRTIDFMFGGWERRRTKGGE